MRRPAALLAAVIGGLALSLAAALTVDVRPAGGPLVLEERVAAAVAAWRDAGVDVDASLRTVRVVYGDPALLGPDVPVLVLTAPDVDLELIVHPDLLDTVPGGLVYAIGVALGGAPGTGTLSGRLEAGVPLVPTAEEAAALAVARDRDPADLTGDGVVDFEDLLALAARFGERGVNLVGDLDGDGVVDARDLALLRERYAFTDPSARPPAPAAATPGGPPPAPGTTPVGASPADDDTADDEKDDAQRDDAGSD